MTDIEALRARIREAYEAATEESWHHEPNSTVVLFGDGGFDLRACPQPEARAHFIALASPANVKALDAEITRLRDDLDRVTRERDGAYLTSQQAAQSYSNLMRVKEDIDAQRQDAEAALAKRDEEVARVKGALWSGICALKEVERNTHYEFDGDCTPENERLIPKLCAAYKGEPHAE